MRIHLAARFRGIPVLVLLCAGILHAQDREVHTFQLQGVPVCPPVRIAPGRVVVATDDRRLAAVDVPEGIVWTLDLPRKVTGPLVLRGSLLQVGLSGGQQALAGTDGSLLARVDPPRDGQAILLDDGTWLALENAGTALLLLAPGGRILYRTTTTVLGLPEPGPDRQYSLQALGGGAVLGLPASPGGGGAAGRWYLDSWVLPVPFPADTGTVIPGETAFSGASFRQDGKEWILRLEDPAGIREYRATGSPVHVLKDSRHPPLVAWGDSRWQFHLAFLDFAGGPAWQSRLPVPDPGTTGNAALERIWIDGRRFADDREAFLWLEAQVLSMGDNWPGRLPLYRDRISACLEGKSLPRELRVRCLGLLCRMPTLDLANRLGRCFLDENDPVVLQAWLDFLESPGVAPAPLAGGILDRKYRRYREWMVAEGLRGEARRTAIAVLARMAGLLGHR